MTARSTSLGVWNLELGRLEAKQLRRSGDVEFNNNGDTGKASGLRKSEYSHKAMATSATRFIPTSDICRDWRSPVSLTNNEESMKRRDDVCFTPRK